MSRFFLSLCSGSFQGFHEILSCCFLSFELFLVHSSRDPSLPAFGGLGSLSWLKMSWLFFAVGSLFRIFGFPLFQNPGLSSLGLPFGKSDNDSNRSPSKRTKEMLALASRFPLWLAGCQVSSLLGSLFWLLCSALASCSPFCRLCMQRSFSSRTRLTLPSVFPLAENADHLLSQQQTVGRSIWQLSCGLAKGVLR